MTCHARITCRKTRAEFTLVELLTVVAIILVLVSLLLPALSSVRVKARSIACMGMMKQVGIQLSGYVADYNGWLPNNDSYRGSSASYNGWNMLLANLGYVDGFPDEIKCSIAFRCPSDNLCRIGNDGVTTDDARTARRCSFYANVGWDGAAANVGVASNGYNGVQINQITQPSTTISMIEAANIGSRMEKVTWAPFSPSDPIINQTSCVAKGSEYVVQRGLMLHNGRNNFIFVDGHIENLQWSSDISHKRLWTLAND